MPEIEWSNFDKHVIHKNIEEREKDGRSVGSHKLTEEMKKTKSNEYIANLDKVVDSDTEEDFDLDSV